MELPRYDAPEVVRYVATVRDAIQSNRAELVSILQNVPTSTLEIAEELRALTGSWNPVELYTADNYEQERATFLQAHAEGREYLPVFQYGRAASFDAPTIRPTLEAIRDRVQGLPRDSTRDRIARITLLTKIQDDLATCDIAEGIQTRDDRLVARGCRVKYPGGDPSLTAFAEEAFRHMLEHPPAAVPSELSAEEKTYLKHLAITPEQQAEAYTWALKEYGMYREEGQEGDGFRVLIDPSATALDVRDKSRLGPAVFIPTLQDESIHADELCALIAHEIEGHARQAVNGMRLFTVGGGALRKDDETLYEGLAMRYEWEFMERYFGEVRADMNLILQYVFAVDIAERGGSFTDIFRDQLERRVRIALKLPLERPLPEPSAIDAATYETCAKRAWRTTYRVMRGHTDTANGERFAMAKDLAYIRGWLMDQELVKQGYGYANEAAIMSVGGLQSLSQVAIGPDDLPIPFRNIAAVYMRTLLEKRPRS